MKQTLLRCPAAFVAAFVLALSLCGRASADGDSLLSGYLRDHADGVSVTCWYENESDANEVESALCAVYDGDGMLLGVGALDPKQGQQTAVVPCATALVDHAKLFALNANHEPLGTAPILKPAADSSDTPRFLTGYPSVGENGVSVSGSPMTHIRVMADRSCRLYWALYRRGYGGYATAKQFISGSLPGSEKHDMMVLAGNTLGLIKLTNLADQTDYDLDLWLTNSDFSASSYIIRLPFTTMDATAPTFTTSPTPSAVNERSIAMQYGVSEAATVYWTVVEGGKKFPNPPSGGGIITKDYWIRQIKNGNGGLSHGESRGRANVPGTFSVYGLTPEKAYDIWYFAEDSAGNYSEIRLGSPDSENAAENPRGVCMTTVYTLDNQAPTVELQTTLYPDEHPETPYADTDLRLIFSENIRRFSTGEILTDVYAAVKAAADEDALADAKETLADFLRDTITLYAGSGTSFAPASERDAPGAAWVVDYRNAVVTWEEDKLVLTFPTTADESADSALRLLGGKSYRFHLQDLSDLSENLNRITSLDTNAVTTMPAQISLQEITLTNANYPSGVSVVDLAFTLTPLAVSRVGDDTAWDLLFWSDKTSVFEIYRRSRLSTSTAYDESWTKLQNPLGTGGRGTFVVPASSTALAGQSANLHLRQYTSGDVPALNALEDGRVYEYAVRFLEVAGESARASWDADLNFGVTAVAGTPSALMNLAANLSETRLEAAKASGSVQEIEVPAPFRMTRTFIATSAPTFVNGSPSFMPSDTSVTVWAQMSRPGTLYYLLAPAGGTVTPRDSVSRVVDWSRYLEIPQSGEDTTLTPFTVSSPNWSNVVNEFFSGSGVKTGHVDMDAKGDSVTVTGLPSDKNYFAFFVLQSGSNYSTSAQMFRFTTLQAAPPSLKIALSNPVAGLSVDQDAIADYVVVNMDENELDPILSAAFWNHAPSGGRAPLAAYASIATVLDAMRADTGAGSVFDVYATADYKSKAAEYLRNTLYDGEAVIGVGHAVRISSASATTVDCSLMPMEDESQYAIVAVAQGTDGGANVFRSAYPITPPDKLPLKVTAVTHSLTPDGDETLANNTFSGTVTLTFDSDLYYLQGDELKIVDLGPHYSTIRDLRHIALVDIASSPSDVMTVSTGRAAYVNQSTNVINLTLKGAANGASMNFPTRLCDEYGNMHDLNLTVRLNLESVPKGADSAGNMTFDYTMNVEISSAWDGR